MRRRRVTARHRGQSSECWADTACPSSPLTTTSLTLPPAVQTSSMAWGAPGRCNGQAQRQREPRHDQAGQWDGVAQGLHGWGLWG